MPSSVGTLFVAAFIGFFFFLASPGVLYAFPEKNIVKGQNAAKMQQANKVNVMFHAVAFGVAMAFALPILQATIGKL